MNHIDFFYDEQIRRFLLQFIRMLSGFQVKFGNDALQTVPVFYGELSYIVEGNPIYEINK